MTGNEATLGYAKAILEVARSEGDIERVADELFRLARILQSHHQLAQGLTDVALPMEAKERLLEEVLHGKVSPHTLNVVAFLVRQGQARSLVEIFEALARMAEAESRREIAEIRTAVPLDRDQLERLTQALGRATGKNITVKVIVDKSVIGGVWARVGDLEIDGSIRRKLESLRDHLKIA